MTRVQKRSRQKVGLRPGSLIHVGDTKVEKVRIRFLDFDGKELREEQVESVEDCFPLRDAPTVSWINLDGLHDVELIEQLGRHFRLHQLLLEDVVNTNQRPKVEDYGDHLFIVVKMLRFVPERREIRWEQFSLVLGDRFVITFQERYGDVFEPVRERLRHGRGRIREAGADYLAYALIDALVDNYFVAVEGAGEQIEELEVLVSAADDPSSDTLRHIYAMKREMIHLRRLVGPVREVANALLRDHGRLMQPDTLPFVRDLADHALRVTELVDSYREMLSSLQDLHLSVVSNRMNEVMKVLTIFASIFIPLTFIAGIYGMNFEHMPELHTRFGYPIVWIVMLLTGGGLLLYFRLKRWI